MKLVSLLALVIGAAVGLYLPDTDRVFPFLLHRSLLTHGVLLPLGVLWLTRSSRAEWQRFALMGLGTALAVHLSFDLFPSLWMGYALISVPFLGQLSGTLSILWIASSIVAALYLALYLMQSKTELTIVFALSAGAFLLAAPGERVFWSALLMLLLGWFAASYLPNQVIHGQDVARRLRPRWF